MINMFKYFNVLISSFFRVLGSSAMIPVSALSLARESVMRKNGN